jgi:hypothetical protein
MPELTRRRSTEAREECWDIYYGDIHAGTIAIRTGNPHDEDPWEGTAASIRTVVVHTGATSDER